MGFPVILPVGPGAAEFERVADTLQSLLYFEPGAGPLFLIDDAEPGARDLSLAVPTGAPAVIVHNPRGTYAAGKPRAGLCTAMLAALDRISALEDPFEWVLRIDTDTLVIAPFADRVSAALRQASGVGLAGTYARNANGHFRDFGVWRSGIRQLRSRVRVYRRPPIPGRYVEQAVTGPPAQMRKTVLLAERHGYMPGENVLSGALVITREFIERTASRGYLDDPLGWVTSPVADDVMVGIFARAVDLDMLDLSTRGGPIGALQVGLPDSPANLLARGFALIHSVKNDPRFSEEEVRAFFRHHRAAAS